MVFECLFTELINKPSLESYWRAIILFGNNVASYKFALAKALLDLADEKTTFIKLEDLAIPFATHIAEHLKHSEKQATSSSSRFLEKCRAFNKGVIVTFRETHYRHPAFNIEEAGC